MNVFYKTKKEKHKYRASTPDTNTGINMNVVAITNINTQIHKQAHNEAKHAPVQASL